MQSDEQLAGLLNRSRSRPLTRREFMRALTVSASAGSGLVAAGLSGFMLTDSQRAEAYEAIVGGLGMLPKVKLGARLGGMEISRIVLCQDSAPDLIEPSLAAGMNFIHKAAYWPRNGVPDAIRKMDRESYYTDVTVDNTLPGHNPDDEEDAYHQVSEQLDRTGLKYFDIFRAHRGWKSRKSFNNGDNASYRAFKRLKREGKVKYFGVSQHATTGEYEDYVTMIEAEIASGVVDSIQCWISYDSKPEILAAFEKAHRAGISITAMKTIRYGGDKMKRDPAKQAEMKAAGLMGRSCLRYALSLKGMDGKPWVDCAVSNMQNVDQFEENIGSISAKSALRDGFDLHLAA
jgi:predicted aldo/keto reductase-like oxidoreductase